MVINCLNVIFQQHFCENIPHPELYKQSLTLEMFYYLFVSHHPLKQQIFPILCEGNSRNIALFSSPHITQHIFFTTCNVYHRQWYPIRNVWGEPRNQFMIPQLLDSESVGGPLTQLMQNPPSTSTRRKEMRERRCLLQWFSTGRGWNRSKGPASKYYPSEGRMCADEIWES